MKPVMLCRCGTSFTRRYLQAGSRCARQHLDRHTAREKGRVITKHNLDTLANRLRAAGLRVTPQRRAVWSAFRAGAGGHLTAAEVFERARSGLPELSRATVYNALDEFVSAGLLQAVAGPGAVRYDSNLDTEHQHFHCLMCDMLYDIDVSDIDTLSIAGKRGFQVERKIVLFEGRCPRCAELASPTTKSPPTG